MSLLQMSLYGACMILFVIIIRAIFIYKLSKKTFTVLWTITLIRLLIPFSVSSAFSIYSIFQKAEPITNNMEGKINTNILPTIANGQVNIISNQISDKTIMVSTWDIVWFIGMLVLIIFFTLIYKMLQKV